MEENEEGILAEIPDPDYQELKTGNCEQAKLKCVVGRMLGILDKRGCALKPPAGMQLEIRLKDGRWVRGVTVEKCEIVTDPLTHTRRQARLLLRQHSTEATTYVLGSQILSIGWWVPGPRKKH